MKPIRTGGQPVALVTGASGGFGFYTSLALAQAGYLVIATMRDLQKRDRLLQEADVSGAGSNIVCMRLDVTDRRTITSTVQEVVARFGRIDVLVNNAGYAAGGFAEEVQPEDWVRQIDTNFFGVIAVTQAVLPVMRQLRRGKIINLSSVSGVAAFPGYGPYAASKFALEGFTEALRLELLPFGIYAVLVQPGSYRTGIWRKGFDSLRVQNGSPYRDMLETVLHISRETAGTARDPREVADLIVKIAGKRKPRLRYPIGRGSRLIRLGKTLMPWTWYEWLIMRGIARKKKKINAVRKKRSQKSGLF